MDLAPKKRGPKKQWTEVMLARFGQSTFRQIEMMLKDGEDRTDFVREAVAREIERRYKICRKSSNKTITVDGRELPVVGRFIETKPFKSQLEGQTYFDYENAFYRSNT